MSATGQLPLAAPGRPPFDAVAGVWRREASMPGSSSIPDEEANWSADTAVAALYTSHWTGLVRLATMLTRDASVAEEIVQDAFVALHGRWHALADRGAAAGYLRTSVVNGARSVKPQPSAAVRCPTPRRRPSDSRRHHSSGARFPTVSVGQIVLRTRESVSSPVFGRRWRRRAVTAASLPTDLGHPTTTHY